MSDSVQNIVQFKQQYRLIVQEIVQIRKQAHQSQKDMADWIKVDRRKIISMESFQKIELEVMLKCADKLSIDVKLSFTVH